MKPRPFPGLLLHNVLSVLCGEESFEGQPLFSVFSQTFPSIHISISSQVLVPRNLQTPPGERWETDAEASMTLCS